MWELPCYYTTRQVIEEHANLILLPLQVNYRPSFQEETPNHQVQYLMSHVYVTTGILLSQH
jgi:hypothetical protein